MLLSTQLKALYMKPIYIMFQVGLPTDVINAACHGIAEMLTIANLSGKVKNFGVWRSSNWLTGNTLNAYESVDWYCSYALDENRNQLHCGKLMEALVAEPWQQNEPHLDIVILKDDLFDTGNNACNWCLGYGVRGYMAISSFNRIQNVSNNRRIQLECFKTIVMHEVGHMLGLVNENRTDIVDNLGWHCTNNKCIMRQGLRVYDWVQYTFERQQSSSPLCLHCQQDLRNYVSSQTIKAIPS